MTVTPLPHVADHRATPEVRPPTPEEVVTWLLRLLGEVGRAPFTIYKVRQVMAALAGLPAQLDELIAALDRTTGVLETSLPAVERRLDELGETFLGVDARMQNLEATVSEFSGNITNLIGAIPGARRTLRKP